MCSGDNDRLRKRKSMFVFDSSVVFVFVLFCAKLYLAWFKTHFTNNQGTSGHTRADNR